MKGVDINPCGSTHPALCFVGFVTTDRDRGGGHQPLWGYPPELHQPAASAKAGWIGEVQEPGQVEVHGGRQSYSSHGRCSYQGGSSQQGKLLYHLEVMTLATPGVPYISQICDLAASRQAESTHGDAKTSSCCRSGGPIRQI